MERKTQFTAGPNEPGEYITTDTMHEELRRPAACVFRPYKDNAPHGTLVAITGPYRDEQSQADARLFAGAATMFALLEEIEDELLPGKLLAPDEHVPGGWIESIKNRITATLDRITNPRPDAQTPIHGEDEVAKFEEMGLITRLPQFLNVPKGLASKLGLDKPAVTDDPTAWPEATWAEVQAYNGQLREIDRATTGRLLKAALLRQWPAGKFTLKTGRYGTTYVSYVWSQAISYEAIRALVLHYEGESSHGVIEGSVALHRWEPTPTGRQLVRLGIEHVSLTPHDASGWDVDPKTGKRERFKNHYNKI